MSGKNKKHLKNELGVVAIIVAISLTVLLGIAAFAVDVGFLFMKKSELQNVADAAALTGAAALVSYAGHQQREEEVKDIIIEYAGRNLTAQDNPEASIQMEDISFQDSNQIEVAVKMVEGRGTEVPLFLANILGLTSADVTATARAEYYVTNGTEKLRPWAVTQKFTDSNRNETYDIGEPIIDYELGEQLSLKVTDRRERDVEVGQCRPVDFPPINKGTPITGSDAYIYNIINGSTMMIEIGDELQADPQDLDQATEQAIDGLIALDPMASWDSENKTITGSTYPDPLASPRAVGIALFNPGTLGLEWGRVTSVTVSCFGGLFIEGCEWQRIRSRRRERYQMIIIARYMYKLAVGVSPPSPAGIGHIYGLRLIKDSTRGGS